MNTRADAINGDKNSDRIHFLATALGHLCLLAMIILPLFWIYGWSLVFSDNGQLLNSNFHIQVDINSIGWAQWLFALIVSGIPVGLTVFAVWHLRKLMQGYSQAEYFSALSVYHLNRFSCWLFISFIAKLILPGLLSLILTAFNPPGEKSLVLQISSETLGALFVAAVFYLVTQIMKEGRKLAEENAEII